MKKTLLYLFAALVSVTGTVSCGDDSNTTNPPAPQPKDFAFQTNELTQGSFGVQIAPEDKTQTYYFNLITKEEYTQYTSGEELQLADFNRITELASSLGVSLEQFLMEALLKGDQEMTYLALTPATPYVFYSYGLSAEGQALTDVNIYEFTTPAVEHMDVTFDITATDITATTFTLNIDPSDDTCFYFYDVMTPDVYEEYCGSDPANIPAFVESYLEAAKEANPDYTMPQFVSAITVRGNCTDSENYFNLLPECTYYAFAVGVANDGTLYTDVTMTTVTTSETPRNEYSIDYQTIEDVSYQASISATQSEPFAVLLERKTYFSDSDTDADIINALYEANGGNLASFIEVDDATVKFTRLIPDEDYYLFIFACNNDGTPKLDEGKINLKKVAIHTAKARMSNAVYTLSTSKVEKTSATLKVYADQEFQDETYMFNYMTKDYYNGIKTQVDYGILDSMDEALQEEMNTFLEEQLENWNASHTDAQMDMKEFLSRALLDGAGELAYYDITDLEPGTEYVIYLFGMKADGTYTTQLFTTEFTTVAYGTSLAELEILTMALDDTENGTTTYNFWCYPGPAGSYDKFYRKGFTETDEWAGKSASEITELLLQEPGQKWSNSYALVSTWGKPLFFYAICVDKNNMPTSVYKVAHTTPEGGEGITGSSFKDVDIEITTLSDDASGMSLNAEAPGLTGPIAKAARRASAPAKQVDAADLERVLLRNIAVNR